MQTLIRVGCCARMRRGIPCQTFRGWHATRRVASIGQREVQFQADGGCAAWRAETMQIVCDFSAADDFCRDAHIDIRRESQRQTRPRRRSKLHVAAQTRTDACRQVVAWTAVLALSLRVAAIAKRGLLLSRGREDFLTQSRICLGSRARTWQIANHKRRRGGVGTLLLS